jgi:ribonuclease VapC
MVVDTSAVIACLLDEPERRAFTEAIDADPVRLISVVGVVEASMVLLGRKRAEGLSDLHAFINDGGIQRVVVDIHQAEMAVDAFRRFGRSRHPAALNIGDCFAYALAKATGEKLLFKGGDFGQTDIAPVIQN